MGPTLVKAAAAGGGGRRPAFTRVGPIDDNRGRVYASLRLGLSPDLARGRERLARGRARPSRRRGDALLVWIFDGFARDYDVRGREGDHGFGEARIRGELYRGRQNHRATALYSVGLATRTMMHSCASAAKFLGGGTILSLGAKAMARCGSPPPRIVARSSEGSLAAGKETPFRERSGEAEASFEPRRLMSRLNPPGRTARRRPARRRLRRSATGRSATCAPSRRSSSCVRRAAHRRCAPQTTWPTRFPSGTSGIAKRAGSCRAARAHCPPAPALSRDAWSRFRRASRSSRRSEPRRAGRAKGFPPPASPPFRGRCP